MHLLRSAVLATGLALFTFVGLGTGSAPARAASAASGTEGSAPAAHGASDANGNAVNPHPHRTFTLTISPFHVLERIVELTGEYRALDKLGIAVVAGIGQYKDDDRQLAALVYEAGAQVRYYLLGDFRHGMQVGAELAYLHVASEQVLSTAEGVGIGPFLGYKIITDVGFTFDGQLGVQYLAAHATSKSGVAPGSETDSTWIPLLNLNVGWSF